MKDKTRLGDFVKIQGGYAFQSALFRKRGIPIIRISNIYGSTIDLKNSAVYYDDTKVIGDDFIAKKDDLLIAMSGATTGKCGVYPYRKCAYVNQRVGKFTLCKGDKAIYKYITYWTQSNDFERQLSRFLVAGAQPNVSPKNIEDMELFLPDITEQQNVIAILDAISANITFLQHLISKQEHIKKSTINLLLKPKADWIKKTIGDVCSFFTSSSKSAYIDPDGQYFIVDMGAVSDDGTLIAQKRTNYAHDFLHKNDLIMPKDDIGGGNIIGKAVAIQENDKYILGDHVYKLQTELDATFLSYLINSPKTNKYMRAMATGSAQLGISKRTVSKCELCFPADLGQQKAIAQKLGAIDEHISNLKLQLKKQKDLKQGLMRYFFGD